MSEKKIPQPPVELTAQQALHNLHSIAEQVALNGEGRDVARASTRVLDEAIRQRDALLAEKEAPKAKKA